MNSKRIPELDGIRGLAILLVIVMHYFVMAVSPTPGALSSYLQLLFINANTGVDLFFVLSGFLIGGILLDNRESPNYFKAFYARRFFRIFPLYYAVLALFYAALAFGAARFESPDYPLFSGALPAWSYLLYVQNFAVAALGSFGCNGLGATWSLAIEEQFYLLAPLVVRRVAGKKLAIGLLIVVALAYVSRLLIAQRAGWPVPVFVLTFCRADTLAIGILTAMIVRANASMKYRPALYAAWAALGFTVLLMSRSHITTSSKSMVYFGYNVFGLFYALTILLAVIHQRGMLACIFRLKPLRELGLLAYCVYLIHAPVNGLCHSLLLHASPSMNSLKGCAVTLAAFLLTITIAHLSWLYFERPLLSMGQAVRYEQRAMVAAK